MAQIVELPQKVEGQLNNFHAVNPEQLGYIANLEPIAESFTEVMTKSGLKGFSYSARKLIRDTFIKYGYNVWDGITKTKTQGIVANAVTGDIMTSVFQLSILDHGLKVIGIKFIIFDKTDQKLVNDGKKIFQEIITGLYKLKDQMTNTPFGGRKRRISSKRSTRSRKHKKTRKH